MPGTSVVCPFYYEGEWTPLRYACRVGKREGELFPRQKRPPGTIRLARLRGLAHGLRPLRPVANGEANGVLRVHSERRCLLACRNGFRTRNVQWRRNSMRRLLFCIVFLLSSVALTVGVPIRGGAQGQPTVSIMVGGLEKIIYLPAMLTERLGYFKEAGVDVTLYNEGAGVSAEDEMLGGGWTGWSASTI